MLKGKVALITGASSGIGRAIALDMARSGADIALNYFGDRSRAEETSALIRKENVNCILYESDVADFAGSKNMVDQVCKDFPHVDILVNNAGIARDNAILRMSEKDFDDVMNVNLKGAFNLIKHLYPCFLKQQSGAIINIASICGLRGWAWQANYASAKGGLIALTKSVAKELASRRVTCNAIAPGFIETDMTAKLTGSEKEKLITTIPLQRAGIPSDVATLATFLAGPGATYITGEIIKVDGGMCI